MSERSESKGESKDPVEQLINSGSLGELGMTSKLNRGATIDSFNDRTPSVRSFSFAAP